MVQPHSRGLIHLYIAALLLSCNGLFAKGITLDATSISQLRSVVAIVALLAFYLFRRQSLQLADKKTYLKTYFLGILLGLHWVTFFAAMQVSTVAIGMVSLFSYPVITVILEPALNKQWPRKGDIIAALIVLLGVFIMMPENNSNGHWQLNTTTVAGVSLGLISALFFSFRNTLQGRLLKDSNAGNSTFHQLIIVSLMLAPFTNWSAAASLTHSSIAQLLALGVLSTALAHSLLVSSLSYLPAKSVAMIGCMQPPVAALLAWLVLQEQPSLQVFIGGAIVLAVALYETWRSR